MNAPWIPESYRASIPDPFPDFAEAPLDGPLAVEWLLHVASAIEDLDRYGLYWATETACFGDGGTSIDELPDWLVAALAVRDCREMRERNRRAEEIRRRRSAIHVVEVRA